MSSDPASTASWGELLRGRNALRSIALAGGVGLHAVNVYIVTTILPSVISEIGGLEYYAWNTTLFVVTSIVGSALSARLIETLGPRRAYLFALAVFSLGTLLCALAPTMPGLLAGRSVQGFGGGVLFALSYALTRTVFEPRLWPRAMALISGMWGVATLSGPAVGGLFAEGGHWRWAFGALLPVNALLAVIVMSQLSSQRGATATRPPLLAIALLVLSVLAISLASLAPGLGWNLAGIAVGIGIGALIARIDQRGATRLLPTGAYSLSTRLGALYAVMALFVVGSTTEIFMPYFLQVIHGLTPLMAGYLTAVMAGGWTLASLFSAARQGLAAERMIRLGPLVIGLALIALAVMTPRPDILDAGGGQALYCLALLGVGFGVGLGWPHLLTRVFTAAAPGEETLASASITTVQLYTTALSAALAGMVTNSAGLVSPGGIEGARHAALWLFASFALAPALACLLLARTRQRPADAIVGLHAD